MDMITRASKLFAAGGISAPVSFRLALEDEVRDAMEMILDWKWMWVVVALVTEELQALEAEDPMAPDYEALDEPTSQYADSRESAEAPAIQ